MVRSQRKRHYRSWGENERREGTRKRKEEKQGKELRKWRIE